MGQINENENPEIILEKLKSITIKDEINTSLDKSFQTIRNILIDYKFYKEIIEKNKTKRKTINYINGKKYSSSHEYSKEELIKIEGNYDKNIIKDVNHKIERIKKWIKMLKYPYSNSNNKNNILDNNDESNLSAEDNLNEIINNIENKLDKDNKKFKNSNNKNLFLSTYSDKKIEYGIREFSKYNNSKFIERIKKGPPDSFRWTSWCIINNLPLDRNNIIYENYTNMSLEKENKDRIIRDIERTFSDKNIDKKELRKMETSLYKILKAFWNLDKEVGYCQGMNLLVGFLLIISDFNERDTFYLLVSNFSDTFKIRQKYEYNFRGLFYEEFPLLYLLNYIFELLLEQYIQDLKNHLENLGISIDLWMGKWFQTVFTIILPINWCKRLWDNIFAENIFFMVKFGIAFTILIKDDLMKMEEEVEILNYFKDFERYSLCLENDNLNGKSDIYSIILKSKKIKIDIEKCLKNFEKEDNGKGFYNKIEKIEDIKYEFYEQIISKPTFQTILFSDDENNKGINSLNNQNINQKEEKIIFEENSIENVNINITNKKSDIINLKNIHPNRNTICYKEKLEYKISEKEIINIQNKFSTERKIDNNNLNNYDKKIHYKNYVDDVIDDNNINFSNSNEEINKNVNITEESINNTYYQNVNENIIIDNDINNIIKTNIDSHQFEKFQNKNRFEDLTFNNSIYKNLTESCELSLSPSQRGRKENIGIKIPKEDDISVFIGKNKFHKKQGFEKDKNENIGIILDKEKITQWC